MSTPIEVSAAQIVAIYDGEFAAQLSSIAAAGLIIYEAIITFGMEVEYFWKRSYTGASVLYLLNKYFVLMFYVFALVLYLPIFTDESCERMQRAVTGLLILEFLPWAAFSALRAYALSKSWYLSAIVLTLSVVPAAVNLRQFIVDQVGGYVDPIDGCVATSNGTFESSVRSVIIARTALIVADALLISITLFNTPWKMLLSQKGTRSLHSVLLRDGILYFSSVIFAITSKSFVTIFTAPCTTILVGRFLLHLQESGTRTLRVDSDHCLALDLSTNSTPSFVRSRVMGSIAHRVVDEDGLDKVAPMSQMD
ncbi:hypothetical protein C8Q76DRAFT_695289 [Earliella scabrosa]|nr:hypothetical protein C8Q76DRAFT_695289 [Earliella scabrosa]